MDTGVYDTIYGICYIKHRKEAKLSLG